jgi:beta-glucosidase-like glycosyl hydrolase
MKVVPKRSDDGSRYMHKMARVAADETRAKTNGEYGRFHSQDYLHSNVIWTPVVNICRDVRWGRCQVNLLPF